MRRFSTRKNNPTENLVENILEYGYDTSALEVIRGFLVGGTLPTDKGVIDVLKFLQSGRSQTEIEWRRIGDLLISEKMGSNPVFVGYEWISFRLPGGSYTPDIAYLFESGKWAFVEIKGSRTQKNYRDARSKLRAVACLNPWFEFYEARNEKRSWQVERIPADTTLVDSLIKFGEDKGEDKNGNIRTDRNIKTRKKAVS